MPGPHTYGRIPFFFALQGEVLAPPRGVEDAAPLQTTASTFTSKGTTHAIT